MLNHLLNPFPGGVGGFLANTFRTPGRGQTFARDLLCRGLGDLVERASRSPSDDNVFDKLLKELDIATCVRDEELSRIPDSGPLRC